MLLAFVRPSLKDIELVHSVRESDEILSSMLPSRIEEEIDDPN